MRNTQPPPKQLALRPSQSRNPSTSSSATLGATTSWPPQQEARKPLPHVSWEDLSIILEMEKHRGHISHAAYIQCDGRKWLVESRATPHTHSHKHSRAHTHTQCEFFLPNNPRPNKALYLLVRTFITSTAMILAVTLLITVVITRHSVQTD